MHSTSQFPFYLPTEKRGLRAEEVAVLVRVLSQDRPQWLGVVPELRVVGRCGCGVCPTVFFQVHAAGDEEQEIASYVGRDQNDGVVGVVIWEKRGKPSQLEFYSADGHDPWAVPDAKTLMRVKDGA